MMQAYQKDDPDARLNIITSAKRRQVSKEKPKKQDVSLHDSKLRGNLGRNQGLNPAFSANLKLSEVPE